ncbi:unnamed protein product, partial [Prorocentrum cordatum]
SFTLDGSSRQRPSTSQALLICAAQACSGARYASRVSSQHRCGSVFVSLSRIHDTAVSWSMTSWSWPGCTEASAGKNAFRSWRFNAPRYSSAIAPEPAL